MAEEKIQLGRYKLVFEFAGQQTLPAFLSVEDVPLLKRIKTNFTFGHSEHEAAPLDVQLPTDETVVLIVQNGSDQTLRFPRLGGTGPYVSVSIRRVDGGYTNEFFYSDDKLLGADRSEEGSISYDTFTWDLADSDWLKRRSVGGTLAGSDSSRGDNNL